MPGNSKGLGIQVDSRDPCTAGSHGFAEDAAAATHVQYRSAIELRSLVDISDPQGIDPVQDPTFASSKRGSGQGIPDLNAASYPLSLQSIRWPAVSQHLICPV